MLTRLIILLIILFPAWASTAWGAAAACSTAGGGAGICYVDGASAGGNGTTTALTGANAAFKTVAAVNALTYAAGDQILFIAGFTSTTQLLPPTSGGAGNPIIYGMYGTGVNPILAGNFSVDTNGKNYLTFNRIHFNNYQVYVNTSTGVTFNYCLMTNSVSRGMYIANSPTTVINNTIISNAATNAMVATGATTTVTIRNSIIIGGSPGDYGIDAAAASNIDYDYSLVTGNNVAGLQFITEGGGTFTDGGHNLTSYDPKLLSYVNNNAYFVFTSDDNLEAGFWTAVIAALPSGKKGSFFIRATGNSVGDIAMFSSMAAAGHEIGLHGWSHTDLTTASLFTVSTTNTNPTINVNRTTKTLTLTSDENTTAVDWSVTDKTVRELKTAIGCANAALNPCTGNGWTITLASATQIDDAYTRLKGLADTAGNDATFPHAALVDVSAGNNYPFWEGEILDAIAWITANVGVTPTTMAYPFGNNNAALQAYVKDVAGLLGARTATVAVTSKLSSLNIYAVPVPSSPYGDKAEATIRALARNQCIFAQNVGHLMSPITHISTDISAIQLGWYYDEINKCGGNIVTFGQAIAAIRADHSTANGLTYTKTYTDASNFKLKPSSPAKDAGVDVGLTTDYAGKTVPVGSAPDIGAYELQGGNRGAKSLMLGVW